jgi:hypothetical protein
MAEWKKVIVSGSTANLAALQVDNLTSGQVVIGGGTSNLSTTAINGTGNIAATTGASGLSHSGSFSGSFTGNFVGTTNLPDLTQGTGITAFTYDGSATATVALKNAGSLSNNVLTKWDSGNGQLINASLTDNGTAITGPTSIQLTGANSNLSGSFSGSFFGNGSGLTGVAAAFPTTAKTDLASTDQFYINDGANKYVTYGNLLTDLAGTNLTVEGTDSLALANTITGDKTFSNNVVISQNLTVIGTASFQNTSNLEVTDRFVLFASGSNTAGDGGIVVQQGIQNVGELFGYEESINRWGFTSSFNASSPNFTAAAMVTTTQVSTAVPTVAPIYGGSSNGFGNIHVKTDTGDIYIYA